MNWKKTLSSKTTWIGFLMVCTGVVRMIFAGQTANPDAEKAEAGTLLIDGFISMVGAATIFARHAVTKLQGDVQEVNHQNKVLLGEMMNAKSNM